MMASPAECEFQLEIVERCPKCGMFHSTSKKHKEKPRWHNADLELPKGSYLVLIWSSIYPGYEIACYSDVGWRDPHGKIPAVSYWRKLPKPPGRD